MPGHEGGTAAGSHTIPGTLVEVFGHGVLLTGASGTGKSETALGLLDRGHRLVADDAVTVQPTAQGALGACPPPLHGLLSLRDLGIVDVAQHLGTEAIAESALLYCTVDLALPTGKPAAADIVPRYDTIDVCGIAVPRLKLTAAPGRDLPLLIEWAVRDLQLRQRGKHPERTLSEALRQQLTGGDR